MLGDDALIYSHRLSEWCSRAPDLEEDIALANIALDLLGQARLLLARAAAADPSVRPVAAGGLAGAARGRARLLPRGRSSSATSASSRPTNGDFAVTIVRLLVFSTFGWRCWSVWPDSRTRCSPRSPPRASRRCLPPRLRRPVVPHPGPGHRGVPAAGCCRAGAGVAVHDELFARPPVEPAVAAAGLRRRPGRGGRRGRRTLWSRCSPSALSSAPHLPQVGPVSRRHGPDGRHTEVIRSARRRCRSSPAPTRCGRW